MNTLNQLVKAKELTRNKWERDFVQSVMSYMDKGRTVSPPQQAVIDRILAYAEPDTGGDYIGISDLLQRAGTRLRKPRITFQIDYTIVRVSLAPANGRNPNSAYITLQDENPFAINPERTYYAKISPLGTLTTSGNSLDSHAINESDITDFLDTLASDPAQAAREYGARTGRCCFCHLPLKTVESTTHGYGPVCADHYELPWGLSSANAILDDETEANRAVVSEALDGQYTVTDTETGTVIATFENRNTAQAYADEWSVVERVTPDQ